MNDTWRLVDCKAVPGGGDVGYLDPFNDAESEALFGVDGIVTTHMPLSQIKEDRRRKPDTDRVRKRASKVGPFQFESILTVYCGSIDCPCYGKIFRLQNKDMNMKGFLYYEKINPETNCIHVHENHNMLPLELKPTSKKYTKWSLSGAMKERFIKRSKGRKLPSGELREVCLEIIDSEEIRTSPEQEDDCERFLAAATNYVNYSTRSKSEHTHFQSKKVQDKTTSLELRQILDHLMSEEGSDERQRVFTSDETNATPYLSSLAFKQTNKFIRVNKHDHNGRTWTYITFEYIFAQKLAQAATEMYPDKRIQLEMDFFMSVCAGNEWQVGHIGFTDRNHKYWILALIISKSENHTAAGLLIERAVEMLRNCGGDGLYALVDGGKALEKAIGVENSNREAKAKLAEGMANALDVAEAEGMVNALDVAEEEKINHEAAAVAVEGVMQAENVAAVGVMQPESDYVFSEDDDILLEAAIDVIEEEAFAGLETASGDKVEAAVDVNDPQRRKALEERLKDLLESYKLGKIRCLAHITRNTGRGGGWRGPKGSLCRALLNNGVPKKEMQKVRKDFTCVTSLPHNDIISHHRSNRY